MLKLKDHPTVKRHYDSHPVGEERQLPKSIDAELLKEICLEAGADDVGFVQIDRKEIADQREDILHNFPFTKTLISFVIKMNRQNVRSPARSVANLEFHHTGDDVNDAARRIVKILEDRGHKAVNGGAMGFPMEMDNWPLKIMVVKHKPVTVAAGLGHMGIHRNVIHPKFGNFILLGTILTELEVNQNDYPIDYNPCLECKLCVAACPVGAISPDGSFNFSSCYTHNYREFMGGFGDWVENIADSKNAKDYRKKTTDTETVSMWQSLSFGANYKAAYCIAVCPAGEDVIGPYLANKKEFMGEVVKPLQQKVEPLYVVPKSDAEEFAKKRFPHKPLRKVGNGLRPQSIEGFLKGLTLVFQKGQSKGINSIYHFTFTGKEEAKATVVIKDKKLEVKEDHHGKPDIHVTADSQTWLGFLAKEKNLVWALIRRKIKMKGHPKHLLNFSKCFPS